MRTLRVERQLGYKSLKFLDRVVVTDTFEDLGKLSEPNNGWAWYRWDLIAPRARPAGALRGCSG